MSLSHFSSTPKTFFKVSVADVSHNGGKYFLEFFVSLQTIIMQKIRTGNLHLAIIIILGLTLISLFELTH